MCAMSNELQQHDPQIYELILQEEARQRRSIRLIPSENYVSKAVMSATGSCLTNKYSEGYPGKRYYEGQQITDIIETVARKRAMNLFGADHANVQPYSGSVANLVAYNSLIEPGDTLMGLALSSGGHLTHGSKHSITSKFFNSVSYTVNPDTGLIDYDEVEALAKKHRPKLIISGTTAYARRVDFAAFDEIARNVDAYHVSDIAHIAGLIAAGVHESPVPFSDIVSTTTHKTLRGPRGGLLLCKKDHAAKLDKAIIPGQQGGPHMHTIASIAVALAEAATEEFVLYARQILLNAKRLAEKLMEYGFDLVSGGTDTHLLLIDLRKRGIPGKRLAKALDRAHIVTNFNTIPGDPASPLNPNGLRLGTPAVTTRGMKETEMDLIAKWIETVADNLNDGDKIERVGREVTELCSRFFIPGYFVAS